MYRGPRQVLSENNRGPFPMRWRETHFEIVTSDWVSSVSIVSRVFVANLRDSNRTGLTLLLVVGLRGTHNLHIP